MSAEQVTRRLEKFENFGFKWIAAGSGGFHHWITANADSPQPEFMACGLCCFHLPLAAAIETDCMTRDRAGDMIVDQMQSGINGTAPGQWAPKGLTRHKTGGRANHPNRGDVVFFSGAGAQYFAHVAVATGNGDDIISFGHDAPYLQGGMHIRLVEKMTIADVKRVNSGLTTVHFGSPCW
jgi:hypothetical protein